MKPVQNKKEIFDLLTQNQRKLAAWGLQKIGLFGSFVRGEQTENSDVDIVAVFENGKKNFKNFIQSVYFLEELFGRKTEMLTHESLPNFVKKEVLKEVEFVVIQNEIEIEIESNLN